MFIDEVEAITNPQNWQATGKDGGVIGKHVRVGVVHTIRAPSDNDSSSNTWMMMALR